jgi:preprotein translocase subunit SecG
MFSTILHVVQVLSALALIGIILIQQGKGASMGAAFGAGASATVFGARGAGSVLTRLTTILAVVFFSVSFYMSYLSAHRAEARSIVEQAMQAGGDVAPAGAAERAAGDSGPVPAQAPADDLPALPADPLPFTAPEAASAGAGAMTAPEGAAMPEALALPATEAEQTTPSGAAAAP